jgi:hypothetical protein
MTPFRFLVSIWYAIFPSGSMLNLAVPVAAVLTVGDIAWPDKIAMKLVCCAKAGIDINDRTNILTDMTGVYLPIGNFLDRFIFRGIFNLQYGQMYKSFT